jgi:hypothetical protein
MPAVWLVMVIAVALAWIFTVTIAIMLLTDLVKWLRNRRTR